MNSDISLLTVSEVIDLLNRDEFTDAHRTLFADLLRAFQFDGTWAIDPSTSRICPETAMLYQTHGYRIKEALERSSLLPEIKKNKLYNQINRTITKKRRACKLELLALRQKYDASRWFLTQQKFFSRESVKNTTATLITDTKFLEHFTRIEQSLASAFVQNPSKERLFVPTNLRASVVDWKFIEVHLPLTIKKKRSFAIILRDMQTT